MSDLASAQIAAAAARTDDDIASPDTGLAAWRQTIDFFKSPAFRVLTKSAHLALAKVVVERMTGRFEITHRMFQDFGIPRDSVVYAVCELEALGVIVVQRRAAKANWFDLSQRWRSITSVEQAVAIRDRARHFGIIRRRKVERETSRIARASLLEQVAEALNAPTPTPALAALDDTALKVLQAIIETVANRTPATYVALRQCIGCSPNRISSALQTLAAFGLIEISRGKRQRNVYKLVPSLPLQREHAST